MILGRTLDAMRKRARKSEQWGEESQETVWNGSRPHVWSQEEVQ